MTAKHRVTIELDEFGWTSLSEEARRQGVPLEELLAHAAMYYLSDLESGRVAARVFQATQHVAEEEEEEEQEPPGEPPRGRRFRPRGEPDE